MPPLLADFIHAGACIPICEKFLTRPKIAEYIRHQLEEDQAGEQLTMGNF